MIDKAGSEPDSRDLYEVICWLKPENRVKPPKRRGWLTPDWPYEVYAICHGTRYIEEKVLAKSEEDAVRVVRQSRYTYLPDGEGWEPCGSRWNYRVRRWARD